VAQTIPVVVLLRGRSGAPLPGNWRPAEVQGIVIGIEHDFDNVRIQKLVQGPDRAGQCPHFSFIKIFQQSGYLLNQTRRHHRLVTLKIDYDVRRAPALHLAHFGDSVSAGYVIRRRHANVGLEFAACFDNPIVIGRDDDLKCVTLDSPCMDMLQHGFAANVQQWFARQPRGIVAGRNDNTKAHLQSTQCFRSVVFVQLADTDCPRLVLQHDRNVITHRERQPVSATHQLICRLPVLERSFAQGARHDIK
jgi:hypothetical protein